MAYSGAWKRNQRFTPAPGDNPNLGRGASRVHLDPVDPGDPFAEPTPALPETPAYLYTADDIMLPVPLFVSDPVDMTPLGHDVGGVDRGETLTESQQLAGAAHMQDFGAAAVHHYEPAIQRAIGDTYRTERVEAEFAVSTSRAALTRGRNSLPENNPEGPPPQGSYVMRWIDRQFTRHSIRTDQQPLRPYRAATAVAIPEPVAEQANQYTSPFASLLAARVRKLTTPQVRRVPRPPDESAETDGTQDPQYSNPAYWDF